MEKYRYVLNLEVGEIDYYYLGLLWCRLELLCLKVIIKLEFWDYGCLGWVLV